MSGHQMDVPLADLPLAAAGAQAMLALADRVLAHEAGVRSGEDPEDLHRMRVATRRLRAALRTFAPSLAERDAADLVGTAGDHLRAMADALGPVRDADVLIASLAADAEAMPTDRAAIERLIADHVQRRDAERVGMLVALNGTTLPWLRGAFRERLAALIAPGGPPRERVRRRAPPLIADRLRQLRRRGRQRPVPTVEQLHRLRIAAKRLRYTAELFQPAFGAPLDDVVALAIDLQDALGALRDDDVAIGVLLSDVERLAADPSRAPDTAALARLIARRRERRAEPTERLQILWPRLTSSSVLERRLEEAAKR